MKAMEHEENEVKFRKIIVGGAEYGWRVWGSAEHIEVRGPSGFRCFANACEVTGLTMDDLYLKNWEFDRRHKHPFYVRVPITPKLIAGWISKNVDEMARATKKRFYKIERYPHRTLKQ